MAFLEINHLKKAFGAHTVVHDFNMNIEQGEFVTFLGPSGCGKTTILRMVAGFETPSSGQICMNDLDVTRLRPNQRDIGMVFQAYALFPNMTVRENIGFSLKIAKKSAAEIRQRVDEMLQLIKLPQLADRYPWQLSGGQQQRVALARALAGEPKLLLLDEPLSALDAKIRVSLRDEIRALQRKLGITSIFVTHDQEEALSISDRIVVMNEGRAEQIGTPFDIYNYPRTRFVASFVGTLNQWAGQLVDASTGKVQLDGVTLTTSRLPKSAASALTLALRPESVRLGDGGEGRNTLAATVEDVNFLGAVVRIRARIHSQTVSFDLFNDPHQPLPRPGDAIKLNFSYDNLLVLEDAPAA